MVSLGWACFEGMFMVLVLAMKGSFVPCNARTLYCNSDTAKIALACIFILIFDCFYLALVYMRKV